MTTRGGPPNDRGRALDPASAEAVFTTITITAGHHPNDGHPPRNRKRVT